VIPLLASLEIKAADIQAALATAPGQAASEELVGNDTQSMQSYLVLLSAMALLPFLLTMVTSFGKLVISLGLLRQAIGTPQIPPTSVLTGIALILSIHIMTPVALDAWSRYETASQEAKASEAERPILLAVAVEESLRGFFDKNTEEKHKALFRDLLARQSGVRGDGTGPARALLPEDPRIQQAFETLTVRAPAFVLTELTRAFQIGFLLFIPFLVIDLVVSNILLAMGMHMMQPTLVSLPLKILLFVLADGWQLLIGMTVQSYTFN
jgi:type III secretion protein R